MTEHCNNFLFLSPSFNHRFLGFCQQRISFFLSLSFILEQRLNYSIFKLVVYPSFIPMVWTSYKWDHRSFLSAKTLANSSLFHILILSSNLLTYVEICTCYGRILHSSLPTKSLSFHQTLDSLTKTIQT